MSLHENIKPGIYIDDATGAIWRKRTPRGPWTVDGQIWKPFPTSLTTLNSIQSVPAVSINDAVNQQVEAKGQGESVDNLKKIHFKTQKEADEVIDQLVHVIDNYGVATIADFFDLSGINSQFMDTKFGWVDLKDASVTETKEGYLIIFPELRPV